MIQWKVQSGSAVGVPIMPRAKIWAMLCIDNPSAHLPAAVSYRAQTAGFASGSIFPRILLLLPVAVAEQECHVYTCPLMQCVFFFRECFFSCFCLCVHKHRRSSEFVFFNLRSSFVRSHTFWSFRSFSHFLFLRHRIMCWPGPLPKG